MKKRIRCFPLLFVLLVSLTACGRTTIKKDALFNYLESTALLPVGDAFVTVKDGTDIQLLSLSNGETEIYLLQSNAVDVQENLHHRNYRLLAADKTSFYYGTQASSHSYGVGNGFRIYRYFPENRKTKLVYKDVSLTNFDAFLGLDEIFSFFAPTVQHGDITAAFCIDGTFVLPASRIAEMLSKSIEAQALDISVSDLEFPFCLADGKIFFCDANKTLWRFDPITKVFTKLSFQTVSQFFVTAQNLFVIPRVGGNILACDFDGTIEREIDLHGAEFTQLYCMVSEDNMVYLKDQRGHIWKIDETLRARICGTIAPEADWTVKDGTIYLYANETIEAINQ